MRHVTDAGGRLLAILVSPEVWAEQSLSGVRFVTAPEQELQLGLIHHGKGYVVPAHLHPPQERTVFGTSEVLFILKGVVKLTMFADGYEYQHAVLREGDVAVLVAGGHMLEVVQDAFFFEVKQGPFQGTKADKIHFTPKEKERAGDDPAAPSA